MIRRRRLWRGGVSSKVQNLFSFPASVSDVSDDWMGISTKAEMLGLWSFNVATVPEFFKKVPAFSLAAVAHQVQCPVFIGDAEEDMFFRGQPQKIASVLGSKAHLRHFTSEEAAGMHCQVGAAALMNAEVFDWLEEKVGI